MMVMCTLLLLAEHVVEHAFELCGDRLREQQQTQQENAQPEGW
jgi:hypothetical protein